MKHNRLHVMFGVVKKVTQEAKMLCKIINKLCHSLFSPATVKKDLTQYRLGEKVLEKRKKS